MKTIVTTLAVAAACVMLVGCAPRQTAITPAPDRGSARGLDPAASGQKSAMEKVNELSEKYAALADKCMTLQKDNEALRDKNRVLADAAAKDKRDLEQVKKELADANTELAALTVDLARWKDNVLGFRKETLDAHVLEMQKLVDIIRLLGGETAEQTPDKTAAKGAQTGQKGKVPDGAAG